MNQLINHPQFGTVRVETINNEPWFVGKDLCEAFGDSNYRRTLANLDADEKGVTHIATPGGKQEMVTVNESGFYHLLFLYQPQKGTNKEIATKRTLFLKKFRKWVTAEVLPSIRKYGTYSTDERTMDRAIKRAEARAVKNLLTEINQTLSGTDKRIIAKQCLTDEYEVQQVLNGRKEDVHMMSLLYARATGNKKYRGAFYSLEGAEQLLNELLKTNDKENSNHY